MQCVETVHEIVMCASESDFNSAQELVRNNLLHFFFSLTNLCAIANVRKVNVSMARHPFFLMLSPSLPFLIKLYPFQYFVYFLGKVLPMIEFIFLRQT